MRTFDYIIPPEYDGVRLEQYLRSVHGYSGRILIRLKKSPDYVQLNGVHARVVDPIHSGDRLRILLEDIPRTPPNPDLAVPVVYEDEDVIVFDQPAHMPVHPSRNHAMDTLGNFFSAYCQRTGQNLVFRPVTRLDADTTGLCLIAKNMLSASKLAGRVEKEYLALVGNGSEPLTDTGTVDAPIARENGDGIRRCVDYENGRRAVTHYQVQGRGPKYTLVRVLIETGRTHQIRVHFAYLGHPLAGDEMYGGDRSDYKVHMLHCRMLHFIHPVTGKDVYLYSKSEIYTNIMNNNSI